MKVKTLQTFKDYEDKEIVSGDKPLALRAVLVNSLNSGKKDMSAEQKVRSYELSLEVMKNEEVTLKSEDITLIKENANALYTPLIYGQLCKFLGELSI